MNNYKLQITTHALQLIYKLNQLLSADSLTITLRQEEILVLWNNHPESGGLPLSYHFSTEHLPVWQAENRFRVERGEVPSFKGLALSRMGRTMNWEMALHCGDMLSVSERDQ